jgi:hypothetical protein
MKVRNDVRCTERNMHDNIRMVKVEVKLKMSL